MPDDKESPSRSSLSKSPSSKETNSSKLSPILPLAPLEYLQNQRRGSITDPSLHAAQKAAPHPFRPHADPSTSLNSTSSSASTYIKDDFTFGDATPRSQTAENNQFRKLLRSPPPPHEPENGKAGGAESPFSRRASIDPLSLRRPSTAGPEVTHSFLGKRKMSSDRVGAAVEIVEGPLAGPGVSGMDVDMEAPAPKRRSSAVDARIARMSLSDRRNSVDSRVTTPGAWWSMSATTSTTTSTGSGTGERRNSTSSGFSTFSAMNPAFSGSEGRAPPGVAAFAWTTNSHPPAESQPMQIEPVDPHSRPQIDPSQPADTGASSSTGPARVLRARSRPPSRQMRSTESSNSQASPSPVQDDPASPAPPTGTTVKAGKEPGSTPYSRSPELRVSHKLAERKRRKEMKELFDELRDQLPADRGMKASKWEILSKAIDFVQQLKQSHQDMAREIEMLRGELEVLRGNPALAQFPPGTPVVYAPGHPHPVPGYPMHPPPGVLPHPPPPPPHHHPPHVHPQPGPPPAAAASQAPLSRPASSQNVYPPPPGHNSHTQRAPSPSAPQQNGTRSEAPPT